MPKQKNWYIDASGQQYPDLLHQRISRIIAFEDFQIKDELVLNAIGRHSTLKSNSSKVDMALFAADKLIWAEVELPWFYDILNTALEQLLEKLVLFI